MLLSNIEYTISNQILIDCETYPWDVELDSKFSELIEKKFDIIVKQLPSLVISTNLSSLKLHERNLSIKAKTRLVIFLEAYMGQMFDIERIDTTISYYQNLVNYDLVEDFLTTVVIFPQRIDTSEKELFLSRIDKFFQDISKAVSAMFKGDIKYKHEPSFSATHSDGKIQLGVFVHCVLYKDGPVSGKQKIDLISLMNELWKLYSEDPTKDDFSKHKYASVSMPNTKLH